MRCVVANVWYINHRLIRLTSFETVRRFRSNRDIGRRKSGKNPENPLPPPLGKAYLGSIKANERKLQMGMIFLGSCGEVIDDPDEFQAAIRPFLEMERQDQRSGPCEDDCQVTAQYIDGSEGRFDPDFGAEMQACEKFLRTGV